MVRGLSNRRLSKLKPKTLHSYSVSICLRLRAFVYIHIYHVQAFHDVSKPYAYVVCCICACVCSNTQCVKLLIGWQWQCGGKYVSSFSDVNCFRPGAVSSAAVHCSASATAIHIHTHPTHTHHALQNTRTYTHTHTHFNRIIYMICVCFNFWLLVGFRAVRPKRTKTIGHTISYSVELSDAMTTS